jgi:anti-sigma regulatory factor (Ser/Thr protein kinase)
MESKQIPIKQDLDVFAARRAARDMAEALGFGLVEATAVETAVSELATNVLRHASEGTMTLQSLEGAVPGLEVHCEDHGPGIPDVEAALRGTAHSGRGLGIGLGGVKRLMDELEIETRLGEGTRITASKWASQPIGKSGNHGIGGTGDPIGNLQTLNLQLATWNVQVAVASRPAAGATANGDAWLVRDYDGRLLIALVDGLGHGEEAAQVAQKAIAYVEQHHRRSLTEVMQGCHETLQGTRGAVLGLALLDPRAGTFTYAGIGNTGVRVTGQGTVRPISLSGIVGYTMRRVREETFPCAPGDLIVMYTDGISERFDLSALLPQTPDLRALAETIVQNYGRENDDATVIATRISEQ